MKARAIMPVNAAVLIVGLIDLVTTLIWVGTGRAIEVNPIMAAVLQAGVLLFILVKLSTLGAYVTVMEWYRRRHNPAFARIMGNFTICAYLCVYAASFCCVNHTYFFG